MARQRIAADRDGQTAAWVGPDGVARVVRLDAPGPPRVQLSSARGAAVTPAAGPGEFLVYDGVRAVLLRCSGEEPHATTEIRVPAGTRMLVHAGRNRLLAATDRSVLGYDGAWHRLATFPCAPVLLAVQPRRDAVLTLTSDGTIWRGDPTGGSLASKPSPLGQDPLAAYDEVLDALWVVPTRSRPAAVLLRVEPWPPKPLYQATLLSRLEGMAVSPNGEWLALWRREAPSLRLYNVSARRVFRPPAEPWAVVGAAFTFDTRLVAVDAAGRVVAVELPARIEARGDGDDLAMDVLWSAKIEKAVGAR